MEGAQLPVECVGHQADVVQLAFSQICDSGYYLASASKDGHAILRHGDTGDWVGKIGKVRKRKTGKAMLCVDINGDATLMATGSEDFTARIWNATSGKQLAKFESPCSVRCVALAAKSAYLAVGCLDQHCHCLDTDLYLYELDRPDMALLLEGQSRGVRDVIFCCDDRALLSSSHDRSIRLWDLRNGRQVHSINLPHHAKSLELNADGRTVTIAYAQSVIFLDVERFQVLQHRQHSMCVSGASLHPAKETYVCAAGNRIHRFEYASGHCLESFVAHEHSVRSIKYSPDGEVFASGSKEGGLRLWQQTVGKKYGLWDTQDNSEQS
ncbi:serine-threonine kinase receptor-associated protein [Drosophila grimshawi]|uniref:Serine-threonine kinase receptor-associated protein n=1 Tax=Drosophila grimshawi TaxID=7222 RepID=B4JVX8_DROGR|nr:serine-threonine kinase receptor-associated protein [Drosophila grimshawi]EDV98116.1 GH22852 [Drosophila grimshawi]